MNKYDPYSDRVKRGYCSRKNDKKGATKIQGSIDPHAMIKTRNFITDMVFTWLIHIGVLPSCDINIVCNKYSVDCCVCIHSVLYITC